MVNRSNLLVLIALLTGIAVWFSGTISGEGPESTATPRSVASTETPSAATPTPDASPDITPTAAPETPSNPAQTETLPLLEGSRPNLVVVDVVYKEPYIVVRYANNGGEEVAADFNISLSANGRTFAGNSNYRYPTPGSGVIMKTGGLTPGLIGLKPGQSADVLVTIDPENRVREILKSDNTMLCRIDLASGTVQTIDPPPQGSAVVEADGPDLIVTRARLDDHKLTVSLANQGNQESEATFTMAIFRGGQQIHSMPNVPVPSPAEQALIMDIPLPGVSPSDIIEIQLDTTGTVSESRENNNSYIRQLDDSHGV